MYQWLVYTIKIFNHMLIPVHWHKPHNFQTLLKYEGDGFKNWKVQLKYMWYYMISLSLMGAW
jgi:hypothetical protein